MRHPRHRGYAMLFVLGVSTIAFLLLTASLHVQYGLYRANQQELERLQQKADALQLTITELPQLSPKE